jgi:hypothetical protein
MLSECRVGQTRITGYIDARSAGLGKAMDKETIEIQWNIDPVEGIDEGVAHLS